MQNNRLIVIACVVVGIALVALAFLYWTVEAKSLPAFLPGYQSGSTTIHTKHGIAAFLLGIGAFVLAWFQSGPRKRGAQS
jgi:hypothetical protein